MIYCYGRIIRVLSLRAGAEEPNDIPLVTFRSSQAAPVPAEAGSDERRLSSDLPHCQPVPLTDMTSHPSIRVSRRIILVTKRRIVRMSVLVVVGFVVCWAPYFVVNLIRVYSDHQYSLTTDPYLLRPSVLLTTDPCLLRPSVLIDHC